jgi:hypothetical protein
MTIPAVISTPDRRVRVFVSSTLQELAPERSAARDSITGLRLTPVMFELGARPHPPRSVQPRSLPRPRKAPGCGSPTPSPTGWRRPRPARNQIPSPTGPRD